MIEDFFRGYSKHYTAHRPGRWCYEDGCLFKGLADLADATGAGWCLEHLTGHVNRWIRPNGILDGYDPEEFSLDNVNAGKVLFALREWTGDSRYEPPLHLMRNQLRDHPRTREGSFWHKKSYPWQVWLDGIYMALPLLVQYGLEYNEPYAIADARGQIATVRRLMRDPSTGLFHHGYDESRTLAWANPDTGLSGVFWSRAMGWYAMALVDLIDILGARHSDSPYYGEQIRDLATSLLPWQRPNGLWMQVMDQPNRDGNYAETSATAMFAYTFLKGHRLGILGGDFATRGRVAYEGILATALAGGELGGICRSAGLGPLEGTIGDRDGSFAYYVGEPIVANDPKGVGPLMMASAELARTEAARRPGVASRS